jgi:hypothetical protein
MEKLGLPTGPNPDGTPNLGLQAMFAQLEGQDTESKTNGSAEVAVILPPPIGMVVGYGKSL